MADRYLIASGNSSNAAIFDGGTFPAAVDTLRTNGFTLTVDANFTVAEITNDIAGGATTAGGQVVLNGGVTLNADLMQRVAVTNNRLITANYGNATSTINGNGFLLAAGSNNMVLDVIGQSNGVLILNGDWTHAAGGVSSATRVITLTGNGQGFRLVFNGRLSASESTSSINNTVDGIRQETTGGGYIIDFNGVVTGRSAFGGGAGTGRGCLLQGSNNTVNIYGIGLGGLVLTNAGSPAILSNNSTNVVNLFGNAVATLTNRAIVGGTVVFQSGANIIDHPENCAVVGLRERLVPFASVVREMVDVNGIDTVNMYTASLLTGYPTEAKVEDGEVFGPVGEFTGTLQPVVINTAQLASDLLTEMNASNLAIAQGLRDGMGASAAAIAAVGSINVIP
jgi:hypothetical protein